MRIVGLLIALALIGCSDDTTTSPVAPVDTGAADVSTSDTSKSDTATVDSGTDTALDTSADADAPVDTFDVCTQIAQTCNEAQPCPGSQRCYGSAGNGFCAPMEPECGGFTNKMCAGGRICLRAGGSSLGYCATPEEKPCICGKPDAGYKLDGCD